MIDFIEIDKFLLAHDKQFTGAITTNIQSLSNPSFGFDDGFPNIVHFFSQVMGYIKVRVSVVFQERLLLHSSVSQTCRTSVG